jgi:hypothetical protein
MDKPIVAVLDTAVSRSWAGIGNGLAPRYFKINPKNHSGKRLYRLVGQDHVNRLIITNVCRELVTDPNHHGKPDPTYVAENLVILKPALILVCGSIAQKAFEESGYVPMVPVITLLHPAARTWTMKLLKKAERQIQKVLGTPHKEVDIEALYLSWKKELGVVATFYDKK